jgi:acyl-CoA hydrolase
MKKTQKGVDCMENWETVYKSKLKTIPELMATIPNGAKICTGIGNGQPRSLSKALADLVLEGNHRDLVYYCTLMVNTGPFANPEVGKLCTFRNGFLSAPDRGVAAQNLIEYVPIMFSDGFRIQPGQYDTVFQTVAPMDRHGYFSLGIEPDYIWDLIKSGNKRVVFEVNENFPATFGNNRIHVSEVTDIVESTWPLAALPSAEPSENDRQIAEHIAGVVPDGACLQLGIGGLPNAIGALLKDKKDLGFHSEMVCNAFLELYKCGALNNSKKNLMPEKGIGTFALGDNEFYEWIEMNPGVEMWPASFVNDPRVACQNDNLITVNGIVELDMLGQCVADEIHGHTYSGLGGQQDFVLAGWWSKGGKSILSMPASRIDKDGVKHSNIVPKTTGAIGETRWNTHYVATEFGIVDLKGLSVAQRVKEILKIADPDFREELEFEARKLDFCK